MLSAVVVGLALFGSVSAVPDAAADLAASVPAAKLKKRSLAGGIDVGRACRWQYGPEWTDNRMGTRPWDWKCVKPGWNPGGVNMHAACGNQWGRAAYAASGATAWDWVCYY